MKSMKKTACLVLAITFPLLFAPADVSARSWEQVALGEASTREDLNDVWTHVSVGAEGVFLEVFAVGDTGTILHYDGTRWQKEESPSIEHLNAVWGISPSDVYVVGNNGTVLHYDGQAWTSIKEELVRDLDRTFTWHLRGAWGSPASGVFIVGETGVILHHDGQAWERQAELLTTEVLNSVWGTSSGTVYAAGNAGTVLRYRDGQWERQAVLLSPWNLNGVWASSPEAVYAVGDNGTVLVFDGLAWYAFSIEAPTRWNAVWGTSPCNIYAVGSSNAGTILRFDGNTWSAENSLIILIDELATFPIPPLKSIHGASLRDVIAVGENGFVLRLVSDEGELRPTVCSRSPDDGQQGVMVDAGISVVFSAPMSRSSLTDTTFTLFSESGPVPGVITVDGNTAFFVPEEALAFDTIYTVTIAGEVADNLGVSLGNDVSWSFSTGSEADEGSNGGCFIAAARPSEPGREYQGAGLRHKAIFIPVEAR
jgi:hypothetical protein